MTKTTKLSRKAVTWTRTLTALGLVGACTVVDKGDYTFTDHPDEGEGGEGAATGGNKVEAALTPGFVGPASGGDRPRLPGSRARGEDAELEGRERVERHRRKRPRRGSRSPGSRGVTTRPVS